MKNIIELLKDSTCMWDELKKDKKPVVLYGMGDGAVKLLSILDSLDIKCSGIFASDDFVRYQSFMGYTVKKLSDLENELGDFTVLSAFATRLDDVIENFYRVSSRHKLKIPDINVSRDHLELFDAAFVEKNAKRLESVYSALDSVGKAFFEELVLYKYTGEMCHLEKIETLRKSSCLPYDKSLVKSFADFGAYTGDTILEAKSLYPQLEKIAGYEPDPKTFKKLEANTKGFDCHLFNALVWDTETELVLRSGGAMNTIIEKNVLMTENLQKKKCTSVVALTGDGSLPFVPDLIKMDVEGCEAKAISGCSRIISNGKPILKISIYHNHRDLFEIYEKIASLNSGYNYTIRQKCRYIPAWDIELIAY